MFIVNLAYKALSMVHPINLQPTHNTNVKTIQPTLKIYKHNTCSMFTDTNTSRNHTLYNKKHPVCVGFKWITYQRKKHMNYHQIDNKKTILNSLENKTYESGV